MSLFPHSTDEETGTEEPDNGLKSHSKEVVELHEPRPTACRVCVLDVWAGRRLVRDHFPKLMARLTRRS